MAKTNKTPGVYIEEKNAFPGSVAAVETAVPVFIGYTQKAEFNGRSLTGKAFRISSLTEYLQYFGSGYLHRFSFKKNAGSSAPAPIVNFSADMLEQPAEIFYLYNCIRLFFSNGGGNCYIFSLGSCEGNGNTKPVINKNDLVKLDVFAKLEKEPEPTLIVLPDFVNERTECYSLYQDVLKHCGKMQSRFGIFDVIPAVNETTTDACLVFRTAIGNDSLNYGAAYYPWLNTNIVQDYEISFLNLDIATEDLKIILTENNVTAVIDAWNAAKKAVVIPITETIEDARLRIKRENNSLHQSLMAASPTYVQIMTEIKNRLNLLPPAAAMAGIYTMVDNARGVWKAPANISLSNVISPAVNLTHDDQENMNIDASSGKSINAIRPFIGKGTLVWGARTLDGNSQEWRYINVRRTITMIEQSLKLACRDYVFEPNVSNTWVTMKSMINNFLINLWQQGALAGAKPEEAFNVQIGLGTTMTQNDILDGYLRISIMLALVRPAEFIVITVQQQQQQS